MTRVWRYLLELERAILAAVSMSGIKYYVIDRVDGSLHDRTGEKGRSGGCGGSGGASQAGAHMHHGQDAVSIAVGVVGAVGAAGAVRCESGGGEPRGGSDGGVQSMGMILSKVDRSSSLGESILAV